RVVLLSPRRPTPTPFPYTTLFRSGAEVVDRQLEAARAQLAQQHAGVFGVAHGGRLGDFEFQLRRVERVLGQQLVEARDQGAAGEDRKSTRLNSSHRTISYAVFCLK